MISIVPNWNPVFVHFTVELLTTAAAHGMAANWFTASASPKKSSIPTSLERRRTGTDPAL